MSQNKYYCIRCKRPNNCECEDKTFCFGMSSKLRPPTSIKNRAKFRKFLDDCPIFINCVPEHLRPAFCDLLREVKYYNKTINGQTWSNIKK